MLNGLLISTPVPGVYIRSGLYEDVVNALTAMISRFRDPHVEVLRFPPIMSRTQLERSGYLKSFPHFLGCVCYLPEHGVKSALVKTEWTDDLESTELVLSPAACYPVYPLAANRGAVPENGLTFDVASDCFRREPSNDIDRLQSFRMREYVRIGTPSQIDGFRKIWMMLAQDILDDLELPCSIEHASDPFFDGDDRATRQIEHGLKFELLIPIKSAEKPTACMSFNYHRDHFGKAWNLKLSDDTPAHTGCVAFGMDRLALALFTIHGSDVASWPKKVRSRLWS